MPVQVCGASKTTRLHYSPVAPVAEFPHPDSFRTCDSQPALLLLSSWQRGREKWDFKGWGGMWGHCRSQSWPPGVGGS